MRALEGEIIHRSVLTSSVAIGGYFQFIVYTLESAYI